VVQKKNINILTMTKHGIWNYPVIKIIINAEKDLIKFRDETV